MADSEAEVVAVDDQDVSARAAWAALAAIEREVDAAGCTVNGGHPVPAAIIEGVHVMRERLERAEHIVREVYPEHLRREAARLAGQDEDFDPDQAFVEWQRLQPSGHAEFFERNRAVAERQAADTLAQAEANSRTWRRQAADPDASSDPEESEQAIPDGLHWSERELWKVAGEGWIDGGEMRTVLARMAGLRAEVRRLRSGEPEVTDTAPTSCTERMARTEDLVLPLGMHHPCSECNAPPGEPCADPLEDRERWAVEHGHIGPNTIRAINRWPTANQRHGRLDDYRVPRHLLPDPEQPSESDDEAAEADRVIGDLITKTGGKSPLHAWAAEVNAEVDALLAAPRAPWIRRDGRWSWHVVYPAAPGEGMGTATGPHLTRFGARFSRWLWHRTR